MSYEGTGDDDKDEMILAHNENNYNNNNVACKPESDEVAE